MLEITSISIRADRRIGHTIRHIRLLLLEYAERLELIVWTEIMPKMLSDSSPLHDPRSFRVLCCTCQC